MIDFLGGGYFTVLLLAEILKILFYGVGLWMYIKWIKNN